MKCPYCNFSDTQVKDSRPAAESAAVKRRRTCHNCGARFTTYERVENKELKIVKKDGNVKPFEIAKLSRSLELALRKRPVTKDQIEIMLNKITRRLETYGEGEVASSIVGKMVMHELELLDKVAYIRYASVYKDFREIDDFNKFIQNEMKENELKQVNDG
jgi:transcriptional repressor NrdR